MFLVVYMLKIIVSCCIYGPIICGIPKPYNLKNVQVGNVYIIQQGCIFPLFTFSCKFSSLPMKCGFYSVTSTERTIMRERGLLHAGSHLQSGMQAAQVADLGCCSESSIWALSPGCSISIRPCNSASQAVGRDPFTGGHLRRSKNTDIYILVHNTGNITVMQ